MCKSCVQVVCECVCSVIKIHCPSSPNELLSGAYIVFAYLIMMNIFFGQNNSSHINQNVQ